MNLGCPKLYRAYSISFNSSNVCNLSWSLILEDCIKFQEKKERVVLSRVLVLDKRAARLFHVVVVKKHGAQAELLFC